MPSWIISIRSTWEKLCPLNKCSYTDKWLCISPAVTHRGLRNRSWFNEAWLVQAVTILGEGKRPAKGEGPCLIWHRGISPFYEFAANATTLAWNEERHKKGNKEKIPVWKQKRETSKEPTPSLTPSFILGPNLRHIAGPPKVNDESGCGMVIKKECMKQARPGNMTIYWKNRTQIVSKARTRQ